MAAVLMTASEDTPGRVAPDPEYQPHARAGNCRRLIRNDSHTPAPQPARLLRPMTVSQISALTSPSAPAHPESRDKTSKARALPGEYGWPAPPHVFDILPDCRDGGLQLYQFTLNIRGQFIGYDIQVGRWIADNRMPYRNAITTPAAPFKQTSRAR